MVQYVMILIVQYISHDLHFQNIDKYTPQFSNSERFELQNITYSSCANLERRYRGIHVALSNKHVAMTSCLKR